jgi:hypothetical protein
MTARANALCESNLASSIRRASRSFGTFALLGGALDDAQQATAGLYRPGGGGEDQ